MLKCTLFKKKREHLGILIIDFIKRIQRTTEIVLHTLILIISTFTTKQKIDTQVGR